MNWFKGLPQEIGEYLYVRYIECGCCIDSIGYVHITPHIFDKPGSLTYNYTNEAGTPLQMHFEGIRPEEVKYLKGNNDEIFVDAWCKYTGPDRSLINSFP